MVIAFVLTMIIYKDQAKPEPKTEEKPAAEAQPLIDKESIVAPIEGKVLPLSEVKDPAFAQGVLGKGLAIEPAKSVVTAPVSGKITTLFPTHHAIGITSDTGMEVLIHVGMDTVQLNGKYFTPLVQEGDKVTQGQKLLDFDMEGIKKEGYSLVTPVIITNTDAYLDVVESGLQGTPEFLTVVR